MVKAGKARVALLFGVVCLVSPKAAVAAVNLNPRYLELLERYARGERPAAIAALGEWSAGALDKQVGIVEDARVAGERCGNCPNPLAGVPLRAAVMLHADRDKVEKPNPLGREQTPRCPGPHARIAARYAAVLARDPQTQDFARRFFLTMALLWQHKACFDDALLQARAGIELFPREAQLYLTAGAVLEERAILNLASGGRGGPEEWLSDARRDFTEAVALDPDLGLARVRLGRVLWRLGKPELAREALEAALARARDPEHRYLAHLFLGRIHEDGQRLDEAVAEYRRAASLFPEAQSAAVALAHGLQLVGEADLARQALTAGLTVGPQTRDAYSDYLAGNTLGADRLEAALHREALE